MFPATFRNVMHVTPVFQYQIYRCALQFGFKLISERIYTI